MGIGPVLGVKGGWGWDVGKFGEAEARLALGVDVGKGMEGKPGGGLGGKLGEAGEKCRIPLRFLSSWEAPIFFNIEIFFSISRWFWVD